MPAGRGPPAGGALAAPVTFTVRWAQTCGRASSSVSGATVQVNGGRDESGAHSEHACTSSGYRQTDGHRRQQAPTTEAANPKNERKSPRVRWDGWLL